MFNEEQHRTPVYHQLTHTYAQGNSAIGHPTLKRLKPSSKNAVCLNPALGQLEAQKPAPGEPT